MREQEMPPSINFKRFYNTSRLQFKTQLKIFDNNIYLADSFDYPPNRNEMHLTTQFSWMYPKYG